ncbi:MAG: secretin N-terminal domain-containing protein [Gemmatimonadota bacterium]
MLPFATPTAILLSLSLSAVPPAMDAGTVTGMQILPATGRTEVVIAVTGDVSSRDFAMEGPHRVVVDLVGARYAMGAGDFPEVNRGGVRAVHASQYSDDIVRLVFELEEPRGYTLLQGDGFVRLSLENPGEAFEPWEAQAAAPGPTEDLGRVPAERAGASRGAAGNGGGAWVGSTADEFAPPITVSFTGTPMRDVLFTFAEFSGRSIVPGSGVSGTVNAEIREQPWDIALQSILGAHGLAAREYASGIIRVDGLQELSERTEVEQLLTRPFRVNYASAEEMVPSVEGLLSSRGRVNVNASTNSLVVTDVPGVLESIETLLEGLDLQTPEITISAKIIFVNRTDLEELGIVYDLRDIAETGMSIPEVGAPLTLVGDDVVAPGTGVAVRGDAIAAIGRAGETVSEPSLAILTQLVLGRFSLISFVTALESLQMSDIQAHPQVRVLDNRPARIHVGERTPVRGVQTQQQGQQEGLFFGPPQIEFVETGIILEVTPSVTTGDLIFMDLLAERSGVEVISEQLGYQFNTQEAQTQVLVQDGETVVIGGLTATEVEHRRVGIPILQHLPVVGRLFGYTAETRTQQDLIILVTPQINRR